METKGKKDKVKIVTLGCAKNLVDSEVMLTQLRGNQIDAHHEGSDKANVVIINTCGFIENAKQESIDTILQYANAKDEGLIDRVYVTGCLSERYKDDLREEIADVDDWFGTSDLPNLLRKFNANYKKELLGERVITTLQHYAYLKISEGCDRPCSFCAIPLMRGKHQSKPLEQIVAEARSLVSKGTKELLLIAQDSTYYGLDIYGKRNLSELLERLADIEGLEWIRIHYAFPTGFPLDILKTIATRPNICNYLDIPLQHGSTRMLKRMRRGTTREKTEQLLDQIRSEVPNIALRTTLIVGHPGETAEDFDEMLNFVEQSRFERLGVFQYSHEENTHAFSMPDDVPTSLKAKRASEIMELQEQISLENNLKKVGQKLNVLVDRFENGQYFGRTEFDSPEVDNEVIINPAESYLRVGDFSDIVIEEAGPFDLIGRPA